MSELSKVIYKLHLTRIEHKLKEAIRKGTAIGVRSKPLPPPVRASKTFGPVQPQQESIIEIGPFRTGRKVM